MPKTKKTTSGSGKSTNTKKQTTSRSKKQAEKPIEKVSGSKNNTRAREEQAPSFVHQATPFIMAIVAIFIGVCVIIGEGKVGYAIKNVMTGLFGGAAYALPVFILIRALLWKRDTDECRVGGRTAAYIVVFTLITMILHLIGGGVDTLAVTEHYKNGASLIGGGVLGGFFGEVFRICFEKVCSLIIIISTAVILTLYIAGITPRSIYVYIAYNIKFAREKRAERAEKRRNAPPSKAQVREEEYLEYLREKKRRERELGKQKAETEYNTGDETQVPLPEATPTVYRVKKTKRVEDAFSSDLEALDSEAYAAALEEETEAVSTELESAPYMTDEFDGYTEDTESNEEAFDDKIFDEVMRRTRERIEKSRKAENIKSGAESTPADDFIGGDDAGVTEEVEASDVLDAVEMASIGIKRMNGRTQPAEDVTDTMKIASAVGSEDAEFDLSGIFVNPEDAELLDKLSAAYAAGGSAKRSDTPEKKAGALSAVPAPFEYKFPPIDILASDPGGGKENIKEELQDNAVRLVETLKSFNVRTKIENISRGPTITRYELLPEPGTRVRSIVNLVDDIALNLATTGVRIEAPIPGKSAVGIEVPNKNQSTVHLRTLIESTKFTDAKSKLTVCLGEDVAGEAVYFDIAKMPHLLIAGATGMGKSVCINSVITSLLYKASPEDVKLILVDPKKVELSIYNGIPHLLVPVVSEPKKAAGSLSWAVGEMERRFALIEAVGVRDIKSFNEVTKNDPDYEYMPRIVIIIDELADLMMTAPDDVEESICRLAQKARAAGMHLIIGTQRPSVDVITGLIKANIPSRIAFTVSSQIDSRTIIDRGGAENLIGRGDMLFNPVGAAKPMRVQGAYVSEADVEEVVAYIKNMNSSVGTYSEEVANQIEREAQRCGGGKKKQQELDIGDDGAPEDPMLKNAIELAIDSGKISTSLIQRRLSLGYGRAAKLIDRMEQLGYVSAPDGQKPREVLITKQDFMEMRLKDEAPFDV